MGLKAVIPVPDGGDIVVDSLTITGLDDSVLITDGAGLVGGAPFGNPGDAFVMSGTGTVDAYSVANGGGLFVRVGETGKVFTSPTGTANWTLRTTPTTQILLCVAYSGTAFAACGLNGTIITSTDGISWTSRTSGVATNLASVTWDGTNSQWVAVGSSQVVLTSPDGITWTSRTYGTTSTIRSVAAGTSVLVAVGGAGVIKTSPTGVTWTLRTSGVATELYNVEWDATNSRFVAVGASGVILTSPDGTTWTTRASGISTFIRNVYWNGTEYVAVGDGGVILNSQNSTTWTAKTSGVSNDLYSSVFASSTWVAVGLDGATITSPDADTWTVVAELIPIFETTSGTGPLLRRDGNKTINGNNTFTGEVTIDSSANNSALLLKSDENIIAFFDGSDNFRGGILQGSAASPDGIRIYNDGPPGDLDFIIAFGQEESGTPSVSINTNTDMTTLLNATVTAAAGTGTRLAAVDSTGVISGTGSESATATLTLSDCSAGGTGDARFTRSGNIVAVDFPDIMGTSNGTTADITGMPAAYIPTRNQFCNVFAVRDNTVDYIGLAFVKTTGVITLFRLPVSLVNGSISVNGTFTASGSKGLNQSSIAYVI